MFILELEHFLFSTKRSMLVLFYGVKCSFFKVQTYFLSGKVESDIKKVFKIISVLK